MRSRQAFTLIELLVVIAIIGLLLGITLPSLSAARNSAKRTACKHNLHAIGLGVKAYLLNNRDTFPYLADFPIPNELPLKPAELPSMVDGFKKEMQGRSDVYRCPADKNTEASLLNTSTYFEIEHTSYEWEATYNGTRIGFTGTVGLPPRAPTMFFRASQMALMFDFENFHGPKTRPGSRNNLYGDLHIESEK